MSREEIKKEVVDIADEYKHYWRDETEYYWLCRLMEEVGELGASLANDHNDPPEHELKQIAAICINWLIMREEE